VYLPWVFPFVGSN